MSKSSAALRPFGARDRVGYMLGNVANDFTFIFASLYLQVFYTDVFWHQCSPCGHDVPDCPYR